MALEAFHPVITLNRCGGVMNSGLYCELTVGFRPTGVGTRAGPLSIADSADASPRMVPLTGTSLGLRCSEPQAQETQGGQAQPDQCRLHPGQGERPRQEGEEAERRARNGAASGEPGERQVGLLGGLL